MNLLIQFLLRLTFGLALGMTITSPKLVTSGYFRNHLYVTLGLASLAALLSASVAPKILGYAVVAAICSYLGSVYWLFEKPAAGKLMLVLVALAAWMGASSQLSIQPAAVAKPIGAVSDSAASVAKSAPPNNAGDHPARRLDTKMRQGFLPEAAVLSSGL